MSSPGVESSPSESKESHVRAVQTPFARLHHFLLGDPIPTAEADEARLPKLLALPIFSSDAISSVVYATQEILLALGAAGLATAANRIAYTHYTWGVTGAIGVLLILVAASYRQTIFAYPSGGGSYLVSKDNLGVSVGLVAAAALLIDYVLTVGVSIASGVQNLATIPLLAHFHVEKHLVPICLFCVALLTLANLRGLRQAGALFAVPTYLFMLLAYTMVVLGLIGPHIHWHLHLEAANQTLPPGYGVVKSLGMLVVLRAFANGCSAMTGTEAISNGIPAFQKPECKNAATTLLWMVCILGSLFFGISWLATKFHIVYWARAGQTAPAVIDQISGTVFGRTGSWSWFYYAMQFATAGILILAANTSFADFPRLASILANDRFLPHQLAHRGDRLVFSSGIVLLGMFSALLLFLFQGSVDRLIPLYALGVFTAFTLSQSGMVVHWFRHKEKGWRLKAFVNGIGAVATAIVFCVILYEKCTEGAWSVLLVAVVLVFLFHRIHKQYDAIWQRIRLDKPAAQPTPIAAQGNNRVLLMIANVHRGIVPALQYACIISSEFTALYVEIDPERTQSVKDTWAQEFPEIKLEVLPSPYRSLVRPVLDYIDKLERGAKDVVTVIIPETFTDHWWDVLLHDTAGPMLKLKLLGRSDVVVANVRCHIEDPAPSS
ncbi:MAG: trkD [Chthonomonadaceae bacterium]|nr:trkD [Chthonomonadaceae bacterium]